MKIHITTEEEVFSWTPQVEKIPITFLVNIRPGKQYVYEEERKKWIDEKVATLKASPNKFRNVVVKEDAIEYEIYEKDYEEINKTIELSSLEELERIMVNEGYNCLYRSDGLKYRWTLE